MPDLEDFGEFVQKDLNDYANECHEANIKWWISTADGVTKLDRNKGELIALMHSELSECLEGERKNLMDDKLPHRRMAEVELVDTLIRIFDYAAAFGYDLEGAYQEKMKFNATREDHTHKARLLAEGKRF
jgi:NTP pyrophosphatase (non-canonical NTP hydrolase)